VRIVTRPGHLDVGLHHARHVGHVGGEPLDDAEIDLAARDLKIDGSRRVPAPRAPRCQEGSSRRSVAGALAGRRNPRHRVSVAGAHPR
jgi:hypothetical protein